MQPPPQLIGFAATGDGEKQHSALDQSQLAGAGGSGVTGEAACSEDTQWMLGLSVSFTDN